VRRRDRRWGTDIDASGQELSEPLMNRQDERPIARLVGVPVRLLGQKVVDRMLAKEIEQSVHEPVEEGRPRLGRRRRLDRDEHLQALSRGPDARA
jgi:hypothetical protein